MSAQKRKNAINNLVSLYTVVIGVALSLAVVTLIDQSSGLKSVTAAPLMLFIGFLATMLPFFHGALRHLDDAYIENADETIKYSALIIDFALLLVHSLAFLVLALLLHQPSEFAWVLVVVLTIDVIWAIFTHFSSSPSQQGGAERTWALINFLFICAGLLALVLSDTFPGSQIDAKKVSVATGLTCVVRSVVDYYFCRDFYFPKTLKPAQ